ncbi:MAG TPA: hypothetical protein VFQ53_02430 [Kofleriaceae bacterium]|nr:hypothetical protein [Kofleriaceae bacterium]
MTRPIALAAFVWLVLAKLAAVAWAGPPKLALPAIEGDDDGELRDAVMEALDGEDIALVGPKATNRATEKLGELSGLTTKQAKQLATELKADAIIYGALQSSEGKSRILHFDIWVNGHKLKGFTIQFTNPHSKKFKKALYEKMVEKLNSPPPDEDDGDGKGKKKKPTDDEEDGKKKQKADADGDGDGDDVDAEDGKKKKKAKKTAATDEDGEDGEDDGVAIVKRAQPKHSANRAAIRLDIGGGGSTRRLTFTTAPDFQDGPPDFKPGAVPNGRFELDAYPFAFGNPDGFAGGIGLGVKYDRALSSHVQPGADGPRLTVKQQQYEVGLRYRWVFTETATSPSVTFGANYGRRTYVPDRGPLAAPTDLDLPDTDYKYIAPSLGLRFPIGGSLAFVVGGEALLVQDAGPIQEADSYGRAKVFGIDSQAGLDLVIKNRFAFRALAEYNRIGFAFTGKGDLANNRDGDPDTIDIGGALDQTIGGSLTFAVLY